MKIQAKQNIWGNWVIYKGRERWLDTSSEFTAKEYLVNLLQDGYKLSDKSEITQAQLEEHLKIIQKQLDKRKTDKLNY